MGIVKSACNRVFPNFSSHLRRELEDCHSILDLGCGWNSLVRSLEPGHYAVGVDCFRPYLQQSKAKGIHADYVLADVRTVAFQPRSFDLVLACDVLEHLDKDEGQSLLRKMELIARKKTVIFTPNGFVSQDEYDENESQVHLAGWTPSELRGLGYEVRGINGLKWLRGERGAVRFKPRRVFCFLSNVSQHLAYRVPEVAFQMLAVKNLQPGQDA